VPKLEIDKIAKAGASAAPAAGSGFIREANSLVTNLKDFIKLAQSVQGVNTPQAAQAAVNDEIYRPAQRLPAPPPAAPPPAPRQIAKMVIAVALDEAVNAGLGDKTVAELLELARPFTVKQLREFLK
jgi:hypothetical protein